MSPHLSGCLFVQILGCLDICHFLWESVCMSVCPSVWICGFYCCLSGLRSLWMSGWMDSCLDAFCPSVWISNCMSVLLFACVDFMSVSGFLVVCLFGCVSGWMSGYLSVCMSIQMSWSQDVMTSLWMSRCPEVWMTGCLSICVNVCLFRYWDTWIYVFLDRCLFVSLDV